MRTWGLRRRRRNRRRRGGPVRRSLPVVALVGAAGLAWGLLALADSGSGERAGELDPDEPARALEAGGSGPEAEGEVPGRAPEGQRIRVEVLNAGGVPGAAAAARDELRERGFDVVYWGNHETFDREETVVLDRVGRLEWARRVAAGVGVERVRSEPEASRLLEVTLLLGSSWEPRESRPEDDEGAPASLRGWLEAFPGF